MTNVPHKRPAFEPASELLRPTTFDPDMKRPLSTVAGALLVFLRVLTGLLLIGAVALDFPDAVRDIDVSFEGVETTPQMAEATLIVLLSVVAAFLLFDAILALLILRGLNWPRVVVMTFSAIAIASSFVQWWDDEEDIRITTTLLGLGLDILILLALSSRSAAAYARRSERH